jgi:hypothetical protein
MTAVEKRGNEKLPEYCKKQSLYVNSERSGDVSRIPLFLEKR